MLSSQTPTNVSVQCLPSTYRHLRPYITLPSCSLKSQVELQSTSVEKGFVREDCQDGFSDVMEGGKGDKGISGIRVPRQKYISVSKSELVDSILSMFDSQEDVDAFLCLSSCLDSILHAEHKGILEEMRIYFCLNKCMEETNQHTNGRAIINSEEKIVLNGNQSESVQRYEEEKVKPEDPDPFKYQRDWKSLLGTPTPIGNIKRNSTGKSRVAVASRFQRILMKLLDDAQFEELSARDLMLTSALNTDYLLTLPVYVDWKRAFESNAIIFRRGYTTEKQKGLLIVEKLDYLQSKLLQGVLFMISKPLGKVGLWLKKVLKSASRAHGVQVLTERIALWLKEPSSVQCSYLNNQGTYDNQLGVDQLQNSDLPIWLAAQKALPHYEGLLSSVGPRGRLLRKLLMWIGLIPSMPERSHDFDNESSTSEPYLRPIFLPRISLSDIWRPATKVSCGNDIWKLLKTSLSILFSKTTLQEPAFQELILFYTEDMGQRETEDNDEAPSSRLKIYEGIPIPDLPVIFPHKKLSFRILDAVRLDVASIVGLLAYIVNYKFENILSSPSAVLLDVIAISALIIYVIRVVLGYKQTRDRYQLLVNKTLYEKTLASGFGSVHFLLDASEQQQYKESILVYALLLQAQNDQVICHESIRVTCEKFMYDKFKKKVAVPVDKAISTLLRLGLVKEVNIDGNMSLQAIQCSEACEALKQRWNCLLD